MSWVIIISAVYRDMQKKLLFQLIAVFVVTQLLGIYVANVLIQNNVSIALPAGGKEDVGNSFFLFGYIIFFTLILLGVIKFAKGRLLYYVLKLFESLAIFTSSLIVFASVYDSVLVAIPSAAIVIARAIWQENLLLRNAATVLAVSGVGAAIGVSLAPLPLLVFMLLLAAYDYIAVFKTKHMVTLAKAVSSKNLAFSYALPTKEHKFELGTGDLVMPLAFSAAILANAKALYIFPFYLGMPALILIASLLGLAITVNIASKQPGKALPALPLQVFLMAISYGGMILAGII